MTMPTIVKVGFTYRDHRIVNMPLWTRQYWPDPHLSRGTELKPLRNYLKLIRCWEALPNGPAYEAFLEIQPYVNDCLENHPSLLRRPRAMYTCCMVGRHEDEVVPAVVLHCDDKKYCKEAGNIPNKSLEWREHINKYKPFMLLIAPHAPSRVAQGGLGAVAYSSEMSPTLFGSLISYEQDNNHPSHLPRMATLGGIILVSKKPYALTVAHALSDPFETDDETSESDWDSDEIYCFGGDGQDLDFISMKDEMLGNPSIGSHVKKTNVDAC
jgi:hypothetical protein